MDAAVAAGWDINKKDKDGNTPLMCAVANGTWDWGRGTMEERVCCRRYSKAPLLLVGGIMAWPL